LARTYILVAIDGKVAGAFSVAGVMRDQKLSLLCLFSAHWASQAS